MTPADNTTTGGATVCLPESDVRAPQTTGGKNGDITNANRLGELFDEALSILGTAGPEFKLCSDAITELKTRFTEERFHLAVLGQFKRGKSTLLNALLGEAILPSSVVPLTAIPTFIRAGETRRALVYFDNGVPPRAFEAEDAAAIREFIAQFVTESGNPKNARGVTQVDVFSSAPILRQGVVLIDTPGIGSTHRHNTEATLNFLPQCDAAMIVVSADPPITEVEVEFVRQVKRRINRLFVVLNKIDYHTEADVREATGFLKSVLADKLGFSDAHPIFPVSAQMGLNARQNADADLWERSGMYRVERHLSRFLASEKKAALSEAVRHKAADVVEEALAQFRLMLRSLQLPAEELDRKRAFFRQKLTEIERNRLVADDLLKGDHRRTRARLEEYIDTVRAQARTGFRGIVAGALARNADTQQAENDARDALAEAIPVFFEQKVGQTSAFLHEEIDAVLTPHQSRAEDLVESVRKAAASIFEVPYQPAGKAITFDIVQKPYWIARTWSTSLSPIPEGFWDRFLPEQVRRRRLQTRLNNQLEDLVISNAENLRWAMLRTVDETFRHFRSTLVTRLGETIAATNGALNSATEKRGLQEEQTASLIHEIRETIRQLENVGNSLRPPSTEATR